MKLFDLNPHDVNTLTSNMMYNQLHKNQDSLTLSTGITNYNTPSTVILPGDGSASLAGQLEIGNTASIGAEMTLAELPTRLVPTKSATCPVTVYRSGSTLTNYVQVVGEDGAGEVIGVHMINQGSYNGTQPTVSTTGAGSGATFSTRMQCINHFQNYTVGQAGYAPGETLTMTGGTFTQATVLTVLTTQVWNAIINNAGSGGLDGPQVLTGTTGTGANYLLNVTVAGGIMVSIDSIINQGEYTVNPNTTADPVIGGGLVGATVTLQMYPKTYSISTPGLYSVVPTNPVTATASGTGHGITFTLFWGVNSVAVTAAGQGYNSGSGLVFSAGSLDASGSLILSDTYLAKVNLINAPSVGDIVCLDGVDFYTETYS